MNIKFILPALTEAHGKYWRPIKYSLFPPLGIATLAGYLARSASTKRSLSDTFRHIAYAGAWKKFDPLWALLIKLRKLDLAIPPLERVLDKNG